MRYVGIREENIKGILFLSLAIVLPFFHNQIVVGSLVNAMLLISVSYMGMKKTLGLCFVPSLVALTQNILPWGLGWLFPFIGIANILFIFAYENLSGSSAKRIVVAAFAKASFLTISALSFFSLLPVGPKIVVQTMGYMQFITALLGGVIFLVIKKRGSK